MEPAAEKLQLKDIKFADTSNFEMTVLPQLRASVYDEAIPSVERVNPVKIESLALASDRSETPLLFDLAATHLAANPGITETPALRDIASPTLLEDRFINLRPASKFNLIDRLKIPIIINFPPQNHSIYSYQKDLLSENILGKPLKLTLKVSCSTTVYNKNPKDSRNTIQCTADLILNLAGIIKNIHLFDFSKIAKSWSSSSNFSGSWGVGIVIPLPPPVSFIQIALNFNIGYTVGLGVYISVSGTQVIAGSYISSALTTSAEAGVRVLVA